MKGVFTRQSFLARLDGPGVIVFLQGCPMRCRYCQRHLDPRHWHPRGRRISSTRQSVTAATQGTRGWHNRLGWRGAPQPVRGRTLRGAHTAASTRAWTPRNAPFAAGSASPNERVTGACDLVLADIKHIDPAEHRASPAAAGNIPSTPCAGSPTRRPRVDPPCWSPDHR